MLASLFTKKRVAVALLMLLALAAAAWFLYRRAIPQMARGGKDVTDFAKVYDARAELDEALAKLPDAPPAHLLVRDDSGRPQVALVLDGLPERTRAAQFVNLFAARKAEVTFFVEGQNAADAPEALRILNESGQEIGNFTNSGVPHMQNLPPEAIVAEVVSAQKVIATLTGRAPTLFRAPECEPTEALLRAVYAAGIPDVVQPDVLITPGMLKSQNDADILVERLLPGSVIAVAVAEPVEWAAPDRKKSEVRDPAIDRKPNIKDKPLAPPASVKSQPGTVSILQATEFLLTALDKRGLLVRSVRSARQVDQPKPQQPQPPQPQQPTPPSTNN